MKQTITTLMAFLFLISQNTYARSTVNSAALISSVYEQNLSLIEDALPMAKDVDLEVKSVAGGTDSAKHWENKLKRILPKSLKKIRSDLNRASDSELESYASMVGMQVNDSISLRNDISRGFESKAKSLIPEIASQIAAAGGFSSFLKKVKAELKDLDPSSRKFSKGTAALLIALTIALFMATAVLLALVAPPAGIILMITFIAIGLGPVSEIVNRISSATMVN